jgi:hypothetical protein
VHRRKTKFAARATHVAQAIETRGVRATYELHDRLGANRSSRRRFDGSRPELDAVQQDVLDRIRATGFAVLPFSELFPDPERWARIEAAAQAFIGEAEAGLAAEAEGRESGLRRTKAKDFVVRRNAWDVTLPLDDPWLALGLDPRMLDLANTYLGLWSKLEYVDVWYTPAADAADRKASQRWHRDFNDRLLLKAFLYLNDVDERSGPFEYVPESFPGGRLGDLWPWAPGGNDGYPPDADFTARLEGEPIQTFTGSRGTLIFCNTAGFHRGGFSTGRERVLATWTYASPAALKALSERNYDVDGDVEALAPAARAAVL